MNVHLHLGVFFCIQNNTDSVFTVTLTARRRSARGVCKNQGPLKYRGSFSLVDVVLARMWCWNNKIKHTMKEQSHRVVLFLSTMSILYPEQNSSGSIVLFSCYCRWLHLTWTIIKLEWSVFIGFIFVGWLQSWRCDVRNEYILLIGAGVQNNCTNNNTFLCQKNLAV